MPDTLPGVRAALILTLVASCSSGDDPPAASPNSPPRFETVAPRSVPVGELFTLVVKAVDPDPGDVVTYAFVDGDPPGATLNPRTGLFGWTPVQSLAGRFLRVTFAAADRSAGRDEMTVLLMIVAAAGEGGDEGASGDGNSPPTIEPLADRTVDVGETVQIEVRAADPDPGDSVQVSIGGRIPPGSVWDSTANRFQWRPPATADGQAYDLYFAASDGRLTVSEQLWITVRKTRGDRPAPDPGGGDEPGPDPPPDPQPCEDDDREAGSGDDEAEHALPLEPDLGRPLRLCPGDPDWRWIDLRVRQDADFSLTADGSVTLELRGPGGLFAANQGAGFLLEPVPVSGRYYLAVHAPAAADYTLDLARTEGGCPDGSSPCLHDDACIPVERLCDDTSDCSDSSDELGCGFDCLSIEFPCDDGSCIPRSWSCDGSLDCPNAEDEDRCESTCHLGEFRCPGTSDCIHPDRVCDDEEDCDDGADEARCAEEPQCDPAYPDVCLPIFPPDVDCSEIEERNFTANDPDPHGLDFDRDGIACEADEG